MRARQGSAAPAAARWLFAALGLAALCGCATNGSQHILRAEEQRARATVMPALRAVPPTALKWSAVEEVTMALEAGGEQPAFAIAGPRGETQIVQLFRLPPWSAPYGINVTSFAVGGLADPALFYPKLVFLDENLLVTRQTRQSDFVYRSVGAQGGISANVFVNEANRGDSYLAIFSEDAHGIVEQDSVMQSSGTMPVVVPVGPYIVTWVVPTGGAELPRKMRALAVGPMRLRIAPYGKKGTP